MAQIDHRQTRRSYTRGALDRSDLSPDPLLQLGRWLDDAADQPDATAMILATADAQARPSARAVLLKHVDAKGLCWYSNDISQKGEELKVNPYASLLFFWAPLERQIRVQGQVEKLSAAEADEYFASRPLGSQQAAVASLQSHPVESREALEQRLAEVEARYPAPPIPRPESWIGYRLVPERFEFWQGRENRLHDRLVYTPLGDGWEIQRLMP
ncbi:Pyridoxamine 5'-phosphate oxidase [Ectothiorhodosinus mongolicus]|uniref:Pyridoxine/pyridoxamine 5'-phosphate oxidase n=1 Tax=Ectothiorhodosinus mongolicus TaxID=233100 RepID=A0A1R3VMT7_9GAMM|nr:pyridoxamine 5'-phosphate oxidase [Ectothiorhodosinus mongolicus]ULX56343.1 pyridoxamine 5'-phosphate oxidase [Ectothiorhodosinus mongolicus]SIT65856.1 Pyridoxamine 5'-phosphate oxidase [Ectothiorhodosinus mongolicus]